MHYDNWMSLAFERFQSAKRNVRLTLPPGKHVEFWERIAELARIKHYGLSITILLDTSPAKREGLKVALQTLPLLENSGHEVSWSAVKGFDFSLFVIDDLSAMIIIGDPEHPDNGSFVHLCHETDDAVNLRKNFDQRVQLGKWGVDPDSWLNWFEKIEHPSPVKKALKVINKNEHKLNNIINKSIKSLPHRSCWLIKPRESAYGTDESILKHQWIRWISEDYISIGWPRIIPHFSFKKMPSRDNFYQNFRKEYPGIINLNRAYAVMRYFVEEMKTGDRIAALEGWNSNQKNPVRFFGWTRLESPVKINEELEDWKLIREVAWRRYELDIPVEDLKNATGLKSATYPIHKISTGAYRDLIALAEEIRRNNGDTQLMLKLPIIESRKKRRNNSSNNYELPIED